MRIALIFISVFVGALIFGAIAAYPVYIGLAHFNELPFHKVISRTFLLSGLLFSISYLYFCGQLTKDGIGWRTGTHTKKRMFVTGLASGVLIVLLLDSSLLLLGIYELDARVDTSAVTLLWVAIKAIATGILVGLVEEIIFRGALFGGLNKQANATIALLATSLVYAAVHFLKFREVPAEVDIGWFTGVEIIPIALFRFSNPVTIDSFITLFILGVLFALIRIRSKSLIPCIALHAGIVAALKFMNYLTNYKSGSSYDFLVNKIDHQFGYLASGLLLLAILIYYFSSSISPGRDAKDELV
ncbi:MAG: membrane protease YdiL (CAAX protease family) [Gammaproteobacteria bacterium]